jgi:hypothetical protein
MCRWRGTRRRGGQKVRPRKRARLVTWPLWRCCPTHQQRVVRRSSQAQVPHQGFGTSSRGQHERERATFAIEIRSEMLRDGSSTKRRRPSRTTSPGRLHSICEGWQASERESSSTEGEEHTTEAKTIKLWRKQSCEESSEIKTVEMWRE